MYRHALTVLATFPVVIAIVVAQSGNTQATPATTAAPLPSLAGKVAVTSPLKVEHKRNLRPRGASKGLLQSYSQHYWAARKKFGKRRVGRNIRKYGIRYRWHRGIIMVRRARASEIRRALNVLKRMLHPPKRFPKATIGTPFGSALNLHTIIGLGRRLQAMGYRVSEHPAFGGVAPVHVSGSRHYVGQAIDVNADGRPGGEMYWLDRIAGWIRSLGFRVIWRAPGHWNHLHASR